MPKRSFKSLSEREILALAIQLEEQDARIYGDFAEGLNETYPATAEMFQKMQKIENEHRHRLFELYQTKYGDHLPAIQREDIKGFVERNPIWLLRPLRLKEVREQAEIMELETQRFYESAAKQTTDINVRKLLGDLALEESKHVEAAEAISDRVFTDSAEHVEKEAHHRLFLLQIVQPGLAGLMDGSVSTLAPLFAAAFATHSSWETFLVGTAASIGAGISMGLTEALSDDGAMTGRGKPYIRGTVCGVMTAVGGLGHTLPYLLPNFYVATGIAVAVVIIELLAISYIRHRYMGSSWVTATLQILVGGLLVFLAGILIGSA